MIESGDPTFSTVGEQNIRQREAMRLPRAAPRKLPVGWSANGLPLVPMYERGDLP